MIATRIMSRKGDGGFRRLGAYVLNAKSEADPASWTRLGAYALDTGYADEKVAWTRVSGCRTSDPGWAVKEIIATQAQNTRAKADKGYHLVVSFPEGERPTREQMERIEDRLCAALGFEDHQRVSAAHINTPFLHLHVAINRIHPKTFKAVHPFRDFYRVQVACAELEVEFGLARGVHSRDVAEAARNSHRDPAKPGLAPSPSPISAQEQDREHEAFRRELAAARAARDKALKALHVQQADYARRLAAWHAERLRQERALDLRGHLRRDGFTHLAERRKRDRAERLAREAEERKRVLAAHPLPRWQDCREPAVEEPAQQRAPLAARVPHARGHDGVGAER